MAQPEISQEQIDRSVEFYHHPHHYLDADLKTYPVVIDCIDPRLKVVSFFKRLVTIQTGGGKIGVGHDEAVARDLSHNLGPATALEGANINARRDFGVAFPHDNKCLAAEGYDDVEAEAIDLSDYSKESLARWHEIHGFDPIVAMQSKVRDGLSRHRELTQQSGGKQNPEDFVDPGWSEVEREYMHMIGPNLSRVYAVVHPHDKRVDRDTRRQMGAQGYQDTIGGLLDYYANLKVSPRHREMLALVALRRSVATRTVVGSPYEDMNYLEVFSAPDKAGGLDIKNVDGPR